MDFKDGFKAGLGFIAARAPVGLVGAVLFIGLLVLLSILSK